MKSELGQGPTEEEIKPFRQDNFTISNLAGSVASAGGGLGLGLEIASGNHNEVTYILGIAAIALGVVINTLNGRIADRSIAENSALKKLTIRRILSK